MWYFDRESTPNPNFKCTFIAKSDAAAVRLGDLQGPIQKIGIGGYLGDPFKANLYDFDGRATLMVNGERRSYLARGSVFLWQPDKVGDLAITVSADEYARRDFTLITFDKNGSLSSNPNEAFAFDDPNLNLVHPMSFRCSFIGPLPKPTEKDG
jgi:hypothetical protein